MFDVRLITACLFGRIGFNPQRDTELAAIDTDLRESRSGMYWEEGHPLVTLENLQAVGDDEDESVYPPYNPATLYKIGDLVLDTGKIYRKRTDSPAGTPVSDTAAWAETSTFGVWLRSKVEGSIKKVVDDLFQRKLAKQVVKSVLEDAYLYDGAGNVQDKEIKEGRFVGYQIIFRGTDGLRAQLNKIGTQFSGAMATPLTLYLYYNGQEEAVATFTLNHAKPNSVQWHDMADLIIQYAGENGVGGAWFLGYYEADLGTGIQAINRTNFNFYDGPCGNCGNNLYWVWQNWFKYLSVIPFAVPAGQLNADRRIWDWTQNQYYHESKTWGFNLQMSITCDVSTVICRQQKVFDTALKLQFAVDMLHEIAYSTRINRIQEKTQQKAMFELDDREKSSQKGFKTQLATALCAIDFDFSNLGSVCTPCAQASGVRATAF